MEGADGIPDIRLRREVAGSRFGTVGADCVKTSGILNEGRRRAIVRPRFDEVQKRQRALCIGERKEHPAAFLAPVDDAGIGEDPDMARDARLALVEQLGELSDRQLHSGEQRDDPQTRRVGHGLEQLGERDRRHGLTGI